MKIQSLFIFVYAFSSALSSPIQEEQFQQAIHMMETKGDYENAIILFEEIATGPDRSLAARALLYVAVCYEKIGKKEAIGVYQRIIDDFSEQESEVAEARERMNKLFETMSEPKPKEPYTRRVWTGPAVSVLGEISPDGRFLSFVNWERGDLAVHDMQSRENRDLGAKEGGWQSNDFAEVSRFSPNGEEIAYGWWWWAEEDKDYYANIMIVARNGENERLLYSNDSVEPTPHDWSPDGRSILAVLGREDGSNVISEISLDGAVRNLRSYDWSTPENMQYSPNGKYIVYDINQGKNEMKRDIMLLWRDVSREVPLVQHMGDDRFLGWCPDGRQILFSSDRRGTIDLWTLDIDDGSPAGEPTGVKSNLGVLTPLGIDNKGRMYYGIDKGSLDIFVTSLDSISAETNPATFRISEIGINRWPQFSPDGKFLAHISQRGRSHELGSQYLTTRLLDNGERREFHLPLVSSLWQPRWSSDGRYIYAAGYGADGQGIFQIDVDTGDTALLIKNPGDTNYQAPDCSPDGQLVYWKQNGRGITVRDLETGIDRLVYQTKEMEWMAAYAVSPDGEQVAFCLGIEGADSLRKVYVMPAGGGVPNLIADVNASSFPNDNFEWSEDGSHIFYVVISEFAELWKISVADGAQSRVLHYPTPGEWNNMAIHTGVGKFAYKQGEGLESEVWMMGDFLQEIVTAKSN